MSDRLRGGTRIGGFLAIHTGNIESIAPALVAPSSGGLSYPYIAAVKSDGVMEVGRYLDFHHSENENDYDARLHTDGTNGGELFINNNKIWHAGNDGSGSGLDADKVDGYGLSTDSVGSTIALRDGSGDLEVRLLRPTYTTNNTSPNYIMTQVETGNGNNNYVRPTSLASLRTSLGKMNDSDKLDGLSSGSFVRSDSDDNISGAISTGGSTSNCDAGIYGSYSSNDIHHIWSMGTSYRVDDSGATFGNLYGLAYKHTNNPTGGTMAGGHQMVWCTNGVGGGAIGTNGMWVKSGSRYYVGTNKQPEVTVSTSAPSSPQTNDIWIDIG